MPFALSKKNESRKCIKSFSIMYRCWQLAFELRSSIQSNDWSIRFLLWSQLLAFFDLSWSVWLFCALISTCMIFFSHHKHIPIRLYFTSSIILESSYSLYDRAFADNIGTVLFYAVIVSLCSFIFVSPIDSSRASRKDLKWIETTKIKLT